MAGFIKVWLQNHWTWYFSWLYSTENNR